MSALVDMGDARDPLTQRLLAGRSAAARKAWRTRKLMAAQRARAAQDSQDGQDDAGRS